MRRAAVAAAVAWGALVFALLQWSTPHLVDRDSLYHARYAQLLPERGLSREFPWTQESVWRDAFSDKEFLFHALLVPFCRGEDPAAGAKVAAWVLGMASCAEGRWGEAIDGLKAAVEKYKGHELQPKMMFTMASAYMYAKDIDNAITVFETIVKDYPDTESADISKVQAEKLRAQKQKQAEGK